MASLPPAEIQYQLVHQNENRGADIIAANTIMLVAAYIAIGLRFMSRRLMHATLGADDWMMVVGLVSPELRWFQGIGINDTSSSPHASLQDAMSVSLDIFLSLPCGPW